MNKPVRGTVVALVVAVLGIVAVGSIGTSVWEAVRTNQVVTGHTEVFNTIRAVQKRQASEQKASQQFIQKELAPVVLFLESAAAYNEAVGIAQCQATPGCVLPPNPPPRPSPFP